MVTLSRLYSSMLVVSRVVVLGEPRCTPQSGARPQAGGSRFTRPAVSRVGGAQRKSRL
jgi:hypothetical protein